MKQWYCYNCNRVFETKAKADKHGWLVLHVVGVRENLA